MFFGEETRTEGGKTMVKKGDKRWKKKKDNRACNHVTDAVLGHLWNRCPVLDHHN